MRAWWRSTASSPLSTLPERSVPTRPSRRASTPTSPPRSATAPAAGLHVGIDAIGHPDVAAASVASLRPRGRHVQVGLLVGDHARTALPMDLVVGRELAVLGSHGMPAVDYPAMLDLVASGALAPERLVARRIGLEDAGAALATMDTHGGPGITLVEP